MEKYNVAVPARKKMDYILYALEEAGYVVDVFSVANSKSKAFLCPKEVRLSDQIRIRYALGVNRRNKMMAGLSTILRFIQIVGYIWFKMSANTSLLVYHSNSFIRPINFARRFKKIRLVLDVEEVYTALFKSSEKEEKNEKSFIESADAYIAVNDVLAQIYQSKGKPAIVAYGDYRMNYVPGYSWNDRRTHIVYAGTIERSKLGAFTAVDTALYLSDEYKMHIIGFGKKDVVKELKERIEIVNTGKGYQAVQYDGFLSGKELGEYLSRCDIGLSTYILTDSFANNSFPSKLMSYVTHNLQVVTGDAEAFRKARVATNWLFYKDYTPEAIAETIMEYKKELRQSNEVIVNELNKSFIQSLETVL